jgi:hypothetical protein
MVTRVAAAFDESTGEGELGEDQAGDLGQGSRGQDPVAPAVERDLSSDSVLHD